MWTGIHPRSARYAHETESFRLVVAADVLIDSTVAYLSATLLYRNRSNLPIGRQTFQDLLYAIL